MQDKEIRTQGSEISINKEIDELTSQVKTLALNLAINLARLKQEIDELAVLEPEFTKLINGSVEVVREVSTILKAYRNEEKLVFDPQQDDRFDRIESSLNEVLNLSTGVLSTIHSIKNHKSKSDKF